MGFDQALRYLGLWSAVGGLVFSAFVIVVFRTGIVYASRNRDGTLKERIPCRGYLAMLVFLLGIVGLQVVANYLGLARKALEVGFFSLFLLNFSHYLVLFAFDTVVIDGLVLSVWRPGFLQLSDAMGWESMKAHILASIPVGTVAGAGLSAMSSVVSYLAFFHR